MKFEGSLLWLQETPTGHRHEPDESNPYPHIQIT